MSTFQVCYLSCSALHRAMQSWDKPFHFRYCQGASKWTTRYPWMAIWAPYRCSQLNFDFVSWFTDAKHSNYMGADFRVLYRTAGDSRCVRSHSRTYIQTRHRNIAVVDAYSLNFTTLESLIYAMKDDLCDYAGHACNPRSILQPTDPTANFALFVGADAARGGRARRRADSWLAGAVVVVWTCGALFSFERTCGIRFSDKQQWLVCQNELSYSRHRYL
jgi:hypothetical protein